MNARTVSESMVAQIWRRQLFTSDGLLQVVYPGRPNTDSGPDFRGAIVANKEGELVTGDVELHVRSSDWRAHGHHRDPAYNGVVLHVAMWDDNKAATVLQSGEKVPTLALYSCLKGTVDEVCYLTSLPFKPEEACHGAREQLGDTKIGQLLDEAGQERFRLKAAIFEASLATQQAAQVLYEGIMRALGYKKNKEAFEELSHRLPFHVLKGYTQGKSPARQGLTLQTLLLGTAGLLPSQRQRKLAEDGLVAEIERIWHSLGHVDSMVETQWCFFRVRPDNSPIRRIRGAAYLLTRYTESGLLQAILDLVKRIQPESGYRELKRGLTVTATSNRAGSPALIGQGRAREIIVNVILPFSLAWAQSTSSPSLEKHVLELYEHYPKLDENEITRQMTKQLLERCSVVDSARRQQGLIHLYHTFCAERRCTECPLS